MRQISQCFLRVRFASGWMRKKGKNGRGGKKILFHPAPMQLLDLNVEVLMGVRCASNQRSETGNVK